MGHNTVFHEPVKGMPIVQLLPGQGLSSFHIWRKANKAKRKHKRYQKTPLLASSPYPLFRRACKLAGVEPSRRQFSKWGNGYGAAFRCRTYAKTELKIEALKRSDA